MTDKILIDRSVVEQALECVKLVGSMKAWDVADSLRIALAMEQPQVEQEPVAWTKPNWRSNPWATAVMDAQKKRDVARNDGTPISKFSAAHTIPLYTNQQPPRQPLADEQLNCLWRQTLGEPHAPRKSAFEFARAIERAHGIGGEA